MMLRRSQLIQGVIQYVCGIIIIVMVGSLPIFLRDLKFDFKGYFYGIKNLVMHFLTPTLLTYDGKRELLPAIQERILQSMKMLSVSFLLALVAAFIFSYFIIFLLKGKKESLLKLIDLIRTVPDVIGIFLLQSLFIWLTKAYGIKLVQTTSLGTENQAILLPILSLSMPIFLFLIQVIILKIYEELDKDYIILAKAKGLSFLYVLNVHVIRNIARNLLGHFKTIVWMMLSTLVMVEYIFNLDGLMMFNIKHISIELFIVSCLLFYTPFFFIYRLIDSIGQVE